MTQTLIIMPKSTKAAQIHLPERNSAKLRQISAKIRQIRQISAKIRQNLPSLLPKFAKLAKFRFTKGL